MASAPSERKSGGFGYVLTTFARWWQRDVMGTVNQAEVIALRREDCQLSARYLLMIAMSAGIAILGLLLSSPAVVIGAMLLSPLMGPIMGLGFAIAIGDFHWMKQSARSLAIGTVIAVFFCALIVAVSPLQTVTTEIAARTKPNLFDLLVALFSAIAGAYAMIRGREGFIVGVAIATALMPPLAVIGFGLATLNWTVFSGALGLFFTNLMAIALTAAGMARIYGFRTNLSEKQTLWQTILIAGAFVALAVPLLLSLLDIARETNASRQVNSVILEAFDDRARLSQIETNFDVEPIQISATILTPQLNPDAERITARAMSNRLGEPVDVILTQYRVGTSAQAAEEAQLTATIAREQADVQLGERLAERLALVAGVNAEDVTIDRERRRATVTARPLDGATLRAYQELERRIAAHEDGEWDIRLIPPVRGLPQIEFGDEGITPAGQRSLGLVEWAAKRTGLPVRLEGRSNAVEFASGALRERGVAAQAEAEGTGFGNLNAVWAIPEEGDAP